METVPRRTRCIVVYRAKNSSTTNFPYDACLVERSLRAPMRHEVMVRIGAAAFNHKDLWIKRGAYPNITVGAVYGTDGAGTVVASGVADDPCIGKRVILVPIRGWKSDVRAPETRFGTLGGGSFPQLGTFAEYVVVDRDRILETLEHLDDVHAAALPAASLTAWRAIVVNAQVQRGDNVLITGIGGGVALTAMQICLALGANVYVTSSAECKIDRATVMGAKGGAVYTQANWPTTIHSLLRKEGHNQLIDSIIDSAGGEIMIVSEKILRKGGRVVCYGMTSAPAVIMTMRQVLANQQLLGSTAGSYQDLRDAIDFFAQHSIVPVVSHIVNGLERVEEGFKVLRAGDQFGKVVIKFGTPVALSKL